MFAVLIALGYLIYADMIKTYFGVLGLYVEEIQKYLKWKNCHNISNREDFNDVYELMMHFILIMC